MVIVNQLRTLGLLAVLVLGVSATLFAQNLLPNPSFETQTGCPTAPGNFTIVGNWYVVGSHSGSPDYFHVCGNTTFGVPSNVFGNQLARTGSAYIGFVTHFGSGNFREYLQVLLPSTLTSGLSYTASAYLTLSDGSGWATDGFGFFFSPTAVTGSGTSAPLPFLPQVPNPTNNFINSKTNWMQVSGNFVATPGLNYLTIGNFKNDATTNVQVQAGWSWNYTYLDDISLTPTVVFTAEMGDFTGEVRENVAILNWDTRSEQGTQAFEVERSIGDLGHFEKIGTVTATGAPASPATYRFHDPGFSPARLNYYRIREVDQNGGGGYTPTIELHTALLVNDVQVVPYPNPVTSGDAIFLNISSSMDQVLQLELIDLQGKVVHATAVELGAGDNLQQLSPGVLASGCYVIRLTGQGVMVNEKVMVN